MTENRRFLLVRRPNGAPVAEDFSLVSEPLPELAEGQFLIRNHYASLDPAMRGWMDDAPSYMPPIPLGTPVRASTVGEVVASKADGFPVGQWVSGLNAIEEYSVSQAGGFSAPIDPTIVPSPTNFLSVLGAVGMTAYFGYLEVCRPQPGDVVLVTGAAGAVGSLVGQIAKIKGASKVIGIAGGPEKCEWLVKEAGYDHAIDYKAGSIRAQLKELAPHGINVIFDNVGGKILNDMLALIATNARVVICGGISRYETGNLPAGPENYFNLVFRRARMQGFIVLDWASEFPDIRRRLVKWVNEGRLAYREDVQHGFENAPATLQRLFSGSNKGKQLLKL